MTTYKPCEESCFNYDPKGRGCSYIRGDFEAAEQIEPGQKCLHPEFSHNQLQEVNLGTLCILLEEQSQPSKHPASQ